MDSTPTPNLLPGRRRVPEHVTCHCEHTTELRIKVGHVWLVLAFVAAIVSGVTIKVVGDLFSAKLRSEPPPGRAGEVLPGIDGHK